MLQLTQSQEGAVHHLLSEMVNQIDARVLVKPNVDASGFWFGGGNVVQDKDGTIWLSGRYRNFGDSRTGLEAGERGLECAIFRSQDQGQTFEKVHGWSKADLSREAREVLSIEGTALHPLPDGSWELYISSEKAISYPADLTEYQKSGTGVWTIDRLTGPSLAELDPQTLESAIENHERPEYLHVKDPVVFDDAAGNTVVLFCSHPYMWSSSNTGLAFRRHDDHEIHVIAWEVVTRGATWDVAATRVTSRMPIPNVGQFADADSCSIYFYDGAESLRSLDENKQAHRRPRGYSCEELGGAFFSWDASFPKMKRLSNLIPLFISPWGTGSSRYVDVLVTDAGILTVWQQSQEDESQPLVGTFLPMDRVTEILSGS